jgi:hypothetical protein
MDEQFSDYTFNQDINFGTLKRRSPLLQPDVSDKNY